MTPNRLPMIMFALMGLVIVAIIGMATGSWVWFAIALAIHLIASADVLTGWGRNATGSERADERSQRLERRAGEAVAGRPRNVETELEALKRE